MTEDPSISPNDIKDKLKADAPYFAWPWDDEDTFIGSFFHQGQRYDVWLFGEIQYDDDDEIIIIWNHVDSPRSCGSHTACACHHIRKGDFGSEDSERICALREALCFYDKKFQS